MKSLNLTFLELTQLKLKVPELSVKLWSNVKQADSLFKRRNRLTACFTFDSANSQLLNSYFYVGLIFTLLIFSSCTNTANVNKAKSNSNQTPEIKKGVEPVADPEIAVIEMENATYGTIKIELYSNIAPKMVARFKELAKEGFYNGVTFHRINNLVIQAGDPITKTDPQSPRAGSGNSDKPDVEAEFSDLKYERGIVGAARTQDVNTANSQFFITLKRAAGFDNRYTIFGKVIEGMNNVDTIAGSPAENEKPFDAIKIKQITIQSR